MPNHVTIKKFAELSGYSASAIRNKKSSGMWPEGVWVQAPDGRILISQEEYDNWAVSGKILKSVSRTVSSRSPLNRANPLGDAILSLSSAAIR